MIDASKKTNKKSKISQGKEKTKQLKSSLNVPRPLRAIRDNCIDCCAGEQAEVKRCQICDCPLWYYRMGRALKQDELKVELWEDKQIKENGIKTWKTVVVESYDFPGYKKRY